MSHKKLIVANWKMNKGLVQSQQFAESLKTYLEKNKGITHEVVLCPPFTSIEAVQKKINGSGIKVGAQNVSQENLGAFTGEISCGMLRSCGCEYVIVGHSERRNYFHETNELINKKVLKVLDEGLKPILCVGETLQEHDDKITEAVIEEQLSKCLKYVSEDTIQNVVIAYEPVWAIGTGKNASASQAESVHNFIRRKIKKMYNARLRNGQENHSEEIKIIYGGSITSQNAKELFTPQTINGGLVGGASLDEQSFIEILNSTH